MHLLKDLLLHLPGAKCLQGQTDVPVESLCINSREAVPGSVFIAIEGHTVDGHQYITQALAGGASVIVAEHFENNISETATFIQVPDSAIAAGQLAAAFWDAPSSQLQLVGITGTNGKTTCATLLYQLFTALGYTCGLLSTVENKIAGETVFATHTTPDALSIQALLRRMADAGCTHVFMEVSSHAVDQQRIAGLQFAGGVFTNISHDHLDYHKTFDAYIKAKKGFFDSLPAGAFALTNADDKRGGVMLQNTAARKCTYSLREPATIKGQVLENNLIGLVMRIDNREVHFRLIGTFNAYNLLAVYGTATLLGEDPEVVLAALTGLEGAAGRFETVRSPLKGILGIVDYAHTPDALLNVLATISQLKKPGQRLITVVGCGGDRDREKRPVMGAAACEHSDTAILTSDNPRFENPDAILDEMEAELTPAQLSKSLRITDRRAAIKTACKMAAAGDLILIAGKGHETYQDVSGVKHPFDDRTILAHLFSDLQL